ncbi:hypothetical protein HDV02_003233 [Globomyces sp. JEL0801]|nr:hypothetical protein HDV02_003233 [Globomyces sp. JEL0801]
MVQSIFPFLSWVRNYNKSYFTHDILAGSTLATMIIPQAMAYAVLACLPPERGLYSVILCAIAHLLFGASPYSSLGPFAVTSLMYGNDLLSITKSFSDETNSNPGTVGQPWEVYPILIPISAFLTFCIGISLAILVISNLNRYLDMLLPPDLISGFTSAATISIITSQVKYVLGLKGIPPIEGNYILAKSWFEILKVIANSHKLTIFVALSTFGIIYLLDYLELHYLDSSTTKKDSPKKGKVKQIPSVLISIIIMSIISFVFDFPNAGIQIVGFVQSGLPDIQNPIEILSILPSGVVTAFLLQCVPTIGSIVLVSYVTNRSVMSMFPVVPEKKTEYNVAPNSIAMQPLHSAEVHEPPNDLTGLLEVESIDKVSVLPVETNELVALAASTILCAIFSGFVPSGSLSRSALLATQTNAKTPLANTISSVMALFTVLYLTPLVYYVPLSSLGIVILLSILPALKKIDRVVELWRKVCVDQTNQSVESLGLWVITFLSVIIWNPSTGVLLGIASCAIWKCVYYINLHYL